MLVADWVSQKAEFWDKFKAHLDVAENSKKSFTARLLHAQLAQVYYRLWEKAF